MVPVIVDVSVPIGWCRCASGRMPCGMLVAAWELDDEAAADGGGLVVGALR